MLKLLLLIVLGRKYLILVNLLCVCSFAFPQQKLPHYKWVSLGPFETPISAVDSGVWTANGIGWIEHVVPGNKKEKRLYAGSNVGGMFVSKNAGKTWKFRFDVDKVCGVWDIAVDLKNKKKAMGCHSNKYLG